MLSVIKKFAGMGLLALGIQSTWGFALLGPNNEAYQIPDIGYNPLPRDGLPTAPKNVDEEYRRNTPVMYYSFDSSFLGFFGTTGAASVDAAFQVYNNLTNVSSYSTDLSEFPSAVTRENYQAEALFLLDIKSATMHAIIEQLGLAEPERYVWTLHDRFQIPGTTCPAGMEYLVIQRNFDPVSSPLDKYQSTSYVNGTLYSYFIREVCASPPGPPLAEALEFQVDPLDFSFTAVASFNDAALLSVNTGLPTVGKFYTGLTRDDVGGLRYLLRAKNRNTESIPPDAVAFVTNTFPQVFYTSNLTLLASQSLTNDAPTVQGLFPGLTILATTNWFVTVNVTNSIPFFTNFPWDPFGTPAHLEFTTNVTPVIEPRFKHTFGNLFTVTSTPNGWVLVPLANIPPATPNGAIVTVQDVTVGTVNAPWAPVGTSVPNTNITEVTYRTNAVVGEFVVFPTNICSAGIISALVTNVIASTNVLFFATNTLVVTNINGGTNAGTILAFGENLVTYSTNHGFAYFPVQCVSNNIANYEGIERVKFVRRDFDSLIGRFFNPVTNTYTMNTLVDSRIVRQTIQRTVTTPDIMFTAQDLAPGPNAPPGSVGYGRNINFNTNNATPGLAGPGTIEAPTVITFNKVGIQFFNNSPNAYFIDSAEANQLPLAVWGSFDGSTNAPIVYPNGATIESLENMILIGVSPGLLPQGKVGVPYGNGQPTFSATGGLPPYTWSLAPDSASLPPGLFLKPNGTLGGTPVEAGTFDFTVRMTDSAQRSVNRGYFITINP